MQTARQCNRIKIRQLENFHKERILVTNQSSHPEKLQTFNYGAYALLKTVSNLLNENEYDFLLEVITEGE